MTSDIEIATMHIQYNQGSRFSNDNLRVYREGPTTINVQLRQNARTYSRILTVGLNLDNAVDVADAIYRMVGKTPVQPAPTWAPPRTRLAILYIDAAGVQTLRVIQPLGFKGALLLAWDEKKREFRTFKLSGILDILELTGEPESLPPPPPPAELFKTDQR